MWKSQEEFISKASQKRKEGEKKTNRKPYDYEQVEVSNANKSDKGPFFGKQILLTDSFVSLTL